MKVMTARKEYIVPFETRPTDSAHASTLVELSDGGILTAWFGGSWEKGPDVAIWTCRRSPEGIWSEPHAVCDTRGIATWNPVLFRYPDNTIVLFYKVGATIDIWQTYYMTSTDEGKTWSESRELVAGDTSGGRGPVKNKPILLADGKTIVAPASFEGEVWDCFVDISQDNGISWVASGLVPVRRASFNIQMVDQPYEPHRCWGKGIIQPTLWESTDGNLHMLCRSTSSAIMRSDSTDGGHTWSMAYESGLPNNNSGIDVVRLANGTLVLAYNPNGNLPNYYKGPRTPLVLASSQDNGATWSHLLTLEDGPGGYAYPAIIELKNHHIAVTYTHKREQICFWDIEIS